MNLAKEASKWEALYSTFNCWLQIQSRAFLIVRPCILYGISRYKTVLVSNLVNDILICPEGYRGVCRIDIPAWPWVILNWISCIFFFQNWHYNYQRTFWYFIPIFLWRVDIYDHKELFPDPCVCYVKALPEGWLFALGQHRLCAILVILWV